MSYRFLRRFFFLLPAEMVHRCALTWLRLRYCCSAKIQKRSPCHVPTSNVFGMPFPSLIGLAAGFDKNGECIDGLLSLGFGFVEVGTVTPRPQLGNPKPRLFRLPEDHALINRMGFNNKGVDYLVDNLKRRNVSGVVGVNIGKNKDTPLSDAAADYCLCLEKVYAHADYIVINVSSPNTPGLRKLHHPDYLSELLKAVSSTRLRMQSQHQKWVPLFLKISVDVGLDECSEIVRTVKQFAIEGIISSNTTVSRDNLKSKHKDEEGGLSGAPLTNRACAQLQCLKSLAGDDLTLISVGGIMTIDEAKRRLSAGADLLQIYTGFVYYGPGFVRRLATATGAR